MKLEARVAAIVAVATVALRIRGPEADALRDARVDEPQRLVVRHVAGVVVALAPNARSARTGRPR
jgi:hypothetical protein